jgi:hypothetical protein
MITIYCTVCHICIPYMYKDYHNFPWNILCNENLVLRDCLYKNLTKEGGLVLVGGRWSPAWGWSHIRGKILQDDSLLPYGGLLKEGVFNRRVISIREWPHIRGLSRHVSLYNQYRNAVFFHKLCNRL